MTMYAEAFSQSAARGSSLASVLVATTRGSRWRARRRRSMWRRAWVRRGWAFKTLPGRRDEEVRACRMASMA